MSTEREPIAIIGSGCRFPGGATTPSKLWDLLQNPPDLRQEIPKSRFDVDRWYHPDNSHHGTSNVRHSYVLDDSDGKSDFRHFDAAFFGVKAVEALAMDPQQRLLLETVYEGLESAGLAMEQLRGSQTGVFVGNMSVDYTEVLLQDMDSCPTYFAPGTARSILSNRISYFFDWHGPSVTIDTACSSSLIAVHQAVQSLRAGEVPVAIAAGANLLISPNQYIAESKLKMLSPNGRSRMWDEAADGYARGDGFAAVVLKTLKDAIRDGDEIECVIRETGTNQDGRTQGITMPSPTAQASLIHQTYQRAGLDLSRPSDRPQYFEAHGTGTPAGDPVESEAISTAFYGAQSNFKRNISDPKLLVGSIKTVIGHTEGTAGLASLLKVSLALRNGKVPPNLHFNRLSPTVKPHYTNLEIPTALMEWPKVPEGGVRRASVNSFGFGGANAHAILEEYIPQVDKQLATAPTLSTPKQASFAPFLFSAASDSALAANIAAHAAYIENTPLVDISHVSYTLYNHRSTLAKRAVFPAAFSRESLLARLRAHSTTNDDNSNGKKSVEPIVPRSLPSKPRTLGIFTGQGAQWPRMGADLIERSTAISALVDQLEESLESLPSSDRPPWSLRAEMLASAGTSQIQKAELSQPLCTALQILLVEALRHAGVTFDTVVGHSSGEIAAAYAAGVITASEAIRIAYYRGFHTHRCQGRQGQGGAMMAVGTSLEDAQELCALDDFAGRLSVAASNSSSSVTLSGDADAVAEAGLILEEEGKFHRALQVDKAYHSHHMEPCLGPYVESLRALNMRPKLESNGSNCTWVSSVHVCDMTDLNDQDVASGVYWAQNMGQTVLFSQACESALRERGPFDQVVEVGPHPALKGPTSAVIEETIREAIPYFGTLSRKRDGVEALSECLGNLWAASGRLAVDFNGYESFMSSDKEQKSPRIVKDLPPYQWDHDTLHYSDSRQLRAIRTASLRPNELLGTRVLDNSPSECRWRNRLSSKEVPWIKHHQVQGQPVFPGAGYISAAVEATRELFKDLPVSVVRLKDFVVGQALIVPDNVGIETLVSLTGIVRTENTITARFTFSAEEGASRSDSVAMNEKASGNLTITLGSPDPDALPPRNIEEESDDKFQMLDIHEDRFYDAVHDLGFGYTGPFRALTDLQRKMDLAMGSIVHPQEPTEGFSDRLLIHPAALDAAIQSIILSYCFPGDTRLRTTHLPTKIDSIQFNVAILESALGVQKTAFRSSVPPGGVELTDINGDVDIYDSESGSTTLIQLQGLHTKPLVPPTPETDLNPFSETIWGPLAPHGRQLALEGEEAISERALFDDLERVAYYYLRNLDRAVPPSERTSLSAHQARLFNYIDHMTKRVSEGCLSHARPEVWKHDTHADIERIIAERQNSSIDLDIMQAVGENLPRVVRGELGTILEPMIQDNKLNRFYVEALGMARYVDELSRMAAQISHRHPHMRVLEVGAGTGGATKILLKHLEQNFDSYHYTDISAGFFPTAQETFSQYSGKMTFKTLDIENDNLEAQGYEEGSFDLVIANLVVHATKNLEATMANLRRLIRPGGYLLLLEITDNDQLRFGFIFGGLPGWWLGEEEERVLGPCVDIPAWDTVMRRTGFSGVDEVTSHVSTCPLSVILTQAVDERVAVLREPLLPAPLTANSQLSNLTILASGTERGPALKLAQDIETILSPYFADIRLITNFESLGGRGAESANVNAVLPIMGSVLSLVELDSPLFKSMTSQRLRAFQHVFKQSRNVFWVTAGARSGDSPYSAMVYGIGRNVVLEMSHIRLQMLDLDRLESADARLLAECLLRFELSGVFEEDQTTQKGVEILWTTEPELAFEKGRGLLIPRVKLSKSRNMRYNASRRPVIREVDPKITPVTLAPLVDGGDHSSGQTSYALFPAHYQAQNAAETRNNTRPDTVSIKVTKSILRSARLPTSDFLFVVAGTSEDLGGKYVVALSDSQSSMVRVDRAWTVPMLPLSNQSNQSVVDESIIEQAMVALYESLLAQTVLHDLESGASLVVLGASPSLAQALKNSGSRRGIRVTILSSINNNKDGRAPTVVPGTVFVHPQESVRSLQSKLAGQVDRVVNLLSASEDAASGGLVNSVIAALPKGPRHHEVHGWNTLTRAGTFLTERTSMGFPGDRDTIDVQSVLRASWTHAKVDQRALDLRRVGHIDAASLQKTGSIKTDNKGVWIVDWSRHSTLPARIQPLSTTITFSPHKTYWLVGLTGGLGQSLAKWMISRGARYMVMTSRKPKLDARWLASVTEPYSATVRAFSVDITSRDAVRAAYRTITTQMPPLGGIAQGAMVLHDTMFAETTMDNMAKVLGPKVQGSVYLDELVNEDDSSASSLDFLVYFSSVAAVTGNKGQSVYAAANTFMTALAAQRRRRGLAGSVINIGAVMGNGYVTRELSLQQQEFLQEVGNIWLSEQDFLTVFAEGVLASRPRSSDEEEEGEDIFEATMGLRVLDSGNEDLEKVTWASNPRFQHLVQSSAGSGLSVGKVGGVGNVPVKKQLEEAKTAEDVEGILQDAFTAKLRSVLQIPAERDILDAGLDDLGMDSLVAVEVRSWLLKELSAEVTVLEVLNSSTVGALLQIVKERVLALISLFPESKPAAAAASVSKPTPEKQPAPPPTAQQPEAKPLGSDIQYDSLEIPTTILSKSSTASETNSLLEHVPNGTPSEATDLSSVPDSPVTAPEKPDQKTTTDDGSYSLNGNTSFPFSKDLIARTVPLSFGQSRFWFLKHFLSDQSAFNITIAVRMHGNLDVTRLAKSVDAVVNHHEALRTAFVAATTASHGQGGDHPQHQLMQVVLNKSPIKLEHARISSADEVGPAYEAAQQHVYDLASGRTLRIQVLSLSPTIHFLVLGYHHINMDGISLEILLRDIQKAWVDAPFSQGVVQYPDFAMREREEYRLGKWHAELQFWKNEFSTPTAKRLLDEPLPLLPALSQKSFRSPVTQYSTTRIERTIPAELSSQIKKTTKKFRVSPFAFYLTILKSLIVRNVGVDDFCIGIGDANRRQADVIESVGLFLNLVPLRVGSCDPAQPFGDALESLHQRCRLALENARVPFDVLLNELGVPRSASHPPLFQVFMNYRQGVNEMREFCDCDCESELWSSGELAYDIAFDVVENPGAGGDTKVVISTQKALYDDTAAGVLLDSFFNLMEAFAGNPASRISKPALYRQAEVEHAVQLGAGPAFGHVWPATVSHRIDDIVGTFAEKLALTDGDGNDLTYAEMGTLVDDICAALDDNLGVGVGSIVGVLQQPTPVAVCSILAVLKSGRVYVPLDPRVGSTRLAAIASEAKPSCVLVDDTTRDDCSYLPASTELIDIANISRSAARGEKYTVQAQPTNLAALVYTSGSTGTPKGISLSHAGVRNNIEITTSLFKLNNAKAEEVILQQTAFSFDISLFQIFNALCSASTLVVAPQKVRGDPAALAALMARTRVTVTAMTPSEYVSLIRHGGFLLRNKTENWRLALSGGEKMTGLMAEGFRSLGKDKVRGLDLFNVYGPAETTFQSGAVQVPYDSDEDDQEMERGRGVVISPPFKTYPNYAVYIVDGNMKPVPLGVVGEVAIGGAGVGLGYLNNEKLTSQKFPSNPYASDSFKAHGWTTMHLTGDLGRLTANGHLILDGRINGDGQAKIRGIRIELEEVELAIVQGSSQGMIEQAAVSVHTDSVSGSEYLVAHVILKDSSTATLDTRQRLLDQLQNHLTSLPQYMRPSAIVPVSALPLTVSNKLDRRALQALPVNSTTVEATTNGTLTDDLSPLECKIKQLWEQVIPGQLLTGRNITSHSDFFHVGGTSLLLVELQSLLKNKLGVNLSVQQLFQSPTLGSMAALAEGGKNSVSKGKIRTVVDWEAEAALLPSDTYQKDGVDSTTSAATVVQTVVLTGATGFLGRHILERLLRDPRIKKVYCIAVRNRDRKASQSLPGIFSDKRVEVLSGDLADLPNLGLSPQDTARIFGAADAVIHNGADVSFMKTYSSLRRTNVEATKQLARLTLNHSRRGVTFHFVSSASVTQLTPLDEVGEVSMAPYKPANEESDGGYVAAKWASERHLELVSEAYGLEVVIHRPSSISGNEGSELDLMGNLFRFVEVLEAVPESKQWKGYFDLISVHSVAAAIVRTATATDASASAASCNITSGGSSESTGEGGKVRYQYEAGEMVYPLSTMQEMAQQTSGEGGGGFPIRSVPLEEWIEAAAEKGLNPLLAAYLRGATANNTRWAFPKLISSSSSRSAGGKVVVG